MASKRRIDYQVGFNADTSSLQSVVQQAQQALQKIGTMPRLQLTDELRQASAAALDLSNQLDKAMNQDTGKLDLVTFNNNLKRNNKSLQQYANELTAIGPAGEQAFLHVAQAIAKSELPLKRTNKLMDDLWVTMKNTMRWQLTSSVMHGFIGAVETAYGYTKDLDRSLNSIRVVTDKNAESMDKFAKNANKAAKALSTTTVDYTDASLIYYQQGLDDEQVEGRTNTTIKLANVARESAEDASEQLTAIWNNFYDGSKSLEYYADVMTALGASTASSTQEISAGLQKFAAVANSVGLSYEYATSALATITATTRESADIVGTSLRTLFARIQGLTQDETQEDGTTLNKYSKALANVGISIKDLTTGEMKNMNDILDEMGEKWNTLSRAEQLALAQTVAGVRQYSQLIALMENYDFFKENLVTAMGAEGSLDRQAQIYAESWEAARDRVRASLEDIYDSLINEDLFIWLDDAFTPVLTGVASIINGLGGMPGLLSTIALLMTKVYGPKMAKNIEDMAINIGIATGKEGERARLLQKETIDIIDNLKSTYAASDAESIKLDLLREEVVLQGKINEKYDELDDYEKSIISDEQKKLELIRQQVLLSTDKLKQRQDSVSSIEDNIGFNIYDSKGEQWKPQIRQELDTWNQKNNQNPLKLDIKSRNIVYQQIKDQMKVLTEERALTKSVYESFVQLDTQSEKYEENLRQLLEVYDKTLNTSSMDKSAMEVRLQNLGNESAISTSKIFELGKLLKILGADSHTVDDYVREIMALGRESELTKEQQEQLNKKVEEFNKLIENVKDLPRNMSLGDTVVQLGTLIGQFTMLISTLDSLEKQLNDEDKSLEDLGSIFTSLSMAIGVAIPIITKAYQGIKLIRTKGIAAAGSLSAVVPIAAAIGIALYVLVKILNIVIVTEKKAAEQIEKANQKYDEQKQKLEDLNNELKTTQDRIAELNNQDTLTLVEQEELKKLERQNKLLERQKKLAEQTEKIARESRAAEREKYGDKSAAWRNNQYSFNSTPKTKEAYEADLALQYGEVVPVSDFQYQQYLDQFAEKQRQFFGENSENLSLEEEKYIQTLQDFEDGIIDQEQLIKQQQILQEARWAMYGKDLEYFNTYMADLYNSPFLNLDELFNKLLGGGEITSSDFSAQFQKQLRENGVFIEDFVNTTTNQFNKLKEQFGDDFQQILGSVKPEDLKYLLQIEFKDDTNIFEKIEKLKNQEINLKVNGLEDFKTLLDKLNNLESPLQKAFDAYGENSFLTVDQVNELIDANADYAKYIRKVGDNYVLTNQSLIDFNRLQRLEIAATDERIAQVQEQITLDRTYLNEQSEFYRQLGETYNNSDFYEPIIEATDKFKEGQLTAGEYFDTLNNQINNSKKNFQFLSGEIYQNIESTNELEQIFVSIIGTVSKELTSLNKQLHNGTINMDEYYRATISAHQALISAKAASSSALYDEESKKWVINIDYRESGQEETQRAKQDMQELNQAQSALNKSSAYQSIVDTLTNQFDKLSDFKNEVGIFNFTDEDILTDKYQTAADEIANSIAQVKDKNEEAFNELVTSMGLQSEIFSDDVGSNAKLLKDSLVESGDAATNKMNSMVSTLATAISETTSAAGELLVSLGDLISNFDYTISFTPSNLQGDNLVTALKSIVFGNVSDVQLPSFDYNISGSGGSNIANFAEKVKSLGSALQDMAKAQKIEDIFGRGGYNNYGSLPDEGILSPSDIPGRKGGKDSSKKLDEEKLKRLEDIEDRYHEINREIQKQKDLLDDIDNDLNRTFGVDKFKNFSKELSALTKQQENYEAKLREAQERYLPQDISKLEELFSHVIIKQNGEIGNYEELLREIVEEHNSFLISYNEFITSYNNMTSAEQEANEAVLEAWKARKESMEEMFKMRQDALKQYEETRDTIQDIKDAIEDNARAIADNQLSQVEYKLEIILDVKSMKDALRDFDIKVNEIFNDALTHGLAVAKLSKDQAEAEAALYPEYKQQYQDLLDLYENSDKYMNREQIIKDIQDLQGKVLGSAEAILEWVNSIEDLIPNAIDAARERYNLFIDQLEHNNIVLDTIKELYALQGVTYKTMDGFNRLQKVSQEHLEAQLAQSQLQRAWYDEARARFEVAQAKLDSLNGDETDLRYDTYKKERDALLAEMNEAEEAYLSLAKDAMETAQEMYEQQLEKAMYDFGQIVSNGIGLDLLQDKYDHYIESNERYFDKVNETYETTAWFNKLQQDIDKATNSQTRDRLKALQEEINVRRENNKLSQYDLDILNAKYAVLQAQMALEDAQNAKNQLKLVRDSQGNWNYQYTADPNQVDNAEQQLMDAQINWYNIAKQQVTDVTGQIINTWQECQDKIKEIYSDMSLTDEERANRAAEIYSYYTEKIKFLEEEKQLSISDMTEAGNANLFTAAVIMGDELTDLTGMTAEDIKKLVEENGNSVIGLLTKDNETIKNIIASNTDLIDLFDNVYAKDLDNMTNNSDNFETALKDALDRAQQDYNNFRDKVLEVGDTIGVKLEDLDFKTNEVSDSTDRLRDSGLDAAQTLWEVVQATIDATSGYLDLADSIWDVIEAMRALAEEQAEYVDYRSKHGMDFDDDDEDLSDEFASDRDWNDNINKPNSPINNPNRNPDTGLGGSGRGIEVERIEDGAHMVVYWDRNKESWEDFLRRYLNNTKKYRVVDQFDTGGYTGEFQGAKLAYLHEKELVLNKDDTKNLLDTINITRNIFSMIEKVLDNNGIATMALMSQMSGIGNISSIPGEIDQTIHIDNVSFPNITSPDGLQEAFISLANDALQWAHRKKD